MAGILSEHDDSGTRLVPLADLKPSEWNPRRVKSKRLRDLVKSIEDDPSFLWDRPILATADGSIYAGEQRYHAARELGYAAVPARISSVDDTTAKARGLRDNAHAGEWEGAKLADVVAELEAAGVDVESIGVDEKSMAAILEGAASGVPETLLDQAVQLRPAREYVVVMCAGGEEFDALRLALGLSTVRRGGYQRGSAFDATGVQRVVAAETLLSLLDARRDS